MNHSSDIQRLTKILNYLLALKKQEAFRLVDIDPDLDKKIKFVEHILEQLKDETNKERHIIAAEEQKRLDDLWDACRKAQKAAEAKKDVVKFEIPATSYLVPAILHLRPEPGISIRKLEKEYRDFVKAMLKLNDEHGNALYTADDFVYIPISPLQLRPVFRFPNLELRELFVEKLRAKGYIPSVSTENNVKNTTMRPRFTLHPEPKPADLEFDLKTGKIIPGLSG